MTSDKIRKKFIQFFEKNKHVFVESSSLWPKDDPSVLLTTAGMQQFKPYLMGEKDPKKDFNSKRLVSVQRCFRTSDIEEVGDPWHLTFFEMLGNFSVGDYFKKEAIDLAWKFLTKSIHINKQRLWVTYFKGDKKIAKDKETIDLWQKYLSKQRIIGFGKQENWWGPASESGPCGPSSEIHYDFTGHPCLKGSKCLPNCGCGRFMEVWNLVFMEYHLNTKRNLRNLPTKNIDTGMGLERLAFIVQKKRSIFEIDLFSNLIKQIKQDENFGRVNEAEDIWRARIVADHLKGSIFLLADGISFSNKEQGYVLRRVFRRALDQYLHARFDLTWLADIIFAIIHQYKDQYPFLVSRQENVINQMNREIEAYKKVLQLDVEEIVNKITHLQKQTKRLPRKGPSTRKLTPQQAFTLYATYGLSLDRLKRKGFIFDEKEFDKEVEKHQRLSRAGAKKKFGGHALTSAEWTKEEREKMTRMHTATHLLHQALRDVLGVHVKQQGSDINPQRLRFDFEHSQKMTEEEKKKVVNIVNQKINENLLVTKKEMDHEKAISSGALAFFKEKYPDLVTVYSIGDYSKELCGGPHAETTGQIGKFKIVSEKSSSAGIRRIKAIIE